MTLNNFNPSNEQMARAKVLQSPELRNILEEMEGGKVIVHNLYTNGLSMCEPIFEIDGYRRLRTFSRKIFQTFLNAGLIFSNDKDSPAVYHLTYDPKVTSIKDVK
jgi:hypothetical protein